MYFFVLKPSNIELRYINKKSFVALIQNDAGGENEKKAFSFIQANFYFSSLFLLQGQDKKPLGGVDRTN